MPAVLLEPEAAVLGGRVVQGAAILVEDGVVAAAGDVDRRAAGAARRRSLPGTLLPGLIDLQVNGAGGHGVDEGASDALDAIAAKVLAGGASAFLPTLITAPFERLLDQIARVAAWIESAPTEGATPLGIHVEGPFLEVSGAHDAGLFLDPTPARIDALLHSGRGQLRLLTLAPSRPGAAAAVARLRAAGVAVSIGHAASVGGFAACVDAGATLVTHLFNAMSPMHHRQPGIVGLALDEHRLSCSMIVDGVHVHPAIVRNAARCLGTERTILITDAVSAAGMPDGDYQLSGIRVRLEAGVVRDRDGRLAGSALTMSQVARNYLDIVPAADAAALARVASTNPARIVGARGWGAIEPRALARFAVLAPGGQVASLRVD